MIDSRLETCVKHCHIHTVASPIAWATLTGDVGYVEDVLLGSSEYSVMRLASFLLHYNAGNLVLEIFKHDKLWGQFALASPTPNSGDSFPRDLRPCKLSVYF